MVAPQIVVQQSRAELNKQAEQLRDTLKEADRVSSVYRATLDNQARGRDYKNLALTAATLATHAKAAQASAANLDQVLTALGGKSG